MNYKGIEKTHRNIINETYLKCKNDCLCIIEKQFPEMSQEQALKIFNFAWEQGHSEGINCVKDWLEEILYLFK